MDPLSIKAFNLGILSAVSLPLGSVLARFWTPRPRMTALLMAFGGGALLAALTIDLVAESVNKGHFTPLFIGCISGGILYEILNQIVNNQGGFLRKASTTINHLKSLRKRHYRIVFKRLSHIEIFHRLTEDEIHDLVRAIRTIRVKNGHPVIRQGDRADAFYILVSGSADILVNDTKTGTLGSEDVFGEIELIRDKAHPASVIATGDVRLYYIGRADFMHLVHRYPHFAQEVKAFIHTHNDTVNYKQSVDIVKADKWFDSAMTHVDEELSMHTANELKHNGTSAVHGSAVLGIWLGIFLDGIPESLVIGSSLLNSTGGHAAISLSLIGGLFLSNFPEALSSSVGMRESGYSFRKIFLMWASLMVFTGIGSYFGSLFFKGVDEGMFVLIEGMAAGAMLTMIAETMLPEAFHKGGYVTGLSTLAGFLAAISMKLIE